MLENLSEQLDLWEVRPDLVDLCRQISRTCCSGTIGSVGVKDVAVTDNQFEYILQPACSYDQREMMILLDSFDGLIFLLALRYCWTIRNVSSTICNIVILVEGESRFSFSFPISSHF
jgi:hypothetical protein